MESRETSRKQSPEQDVIPQSVPRRLLPWPSEDGKPCYLVSNADEGYLSRLADDMEAEQLATGTEVLGHAKKVLDDLMSPYAEVRYAGIRLAECLSDVLRVAESRGMRLSVPESEPDVQQTSEPARTTGPARAGRTAKATGRTAQATGKTGGTGRPRPSTGDA